MSIGTREVVIGLVLVIGGAAYLAWNQQTSERAAQQAARTEKPPAPTRDAQAMVIYKWQDDSGTWTFGENPPQDGRPYSEIRGTPNVTSVPTVVPDDGPAIDQAPAPEATDSP
ncbi:hypothetical protein C7S18_19010 [Ahniella affigens]|uniref:DUF4124 domain-containing protein n=1 Tax=Ahniella affigens TaxID=2021234 RepID=A0A2P1PWB5_9GAMM|nr:DUF4124 domain-containing protein [Ahniella affigens]AVP99130.1 hypothetical protein C7S18_19010 [Ahniella affigens]